MQSSEENRQRLGDAEGVDALLRAVAPYKARPGPARPTLGSRLRADRLGVDGSGRIVHDSRFTVHGSPFTVHRSPFTVHDSRFTVHGLRFTVHDSRFTVHGSRFKVKDLGFGV